MFECEQCKAKFESKRIRIQYAHTKLDEEPVTVSFFACPNCERRYIIAVDNDDTDKDKKELRELAAVIKKYTGLRSTRPEQRQWERLKNKTAIKQNALIEKYINLNG